MMELAGHEELGIADLALVVNGVPFVTDSGATLTGFRLVRALDRPCELALRFTLPSRGWSSLPPIGATVMLQVQGNDLFSGQVAVCDATSGPEGNFVDLIVYDQMVGLSEMRTPGVEIVSSLHSFVGRFAQRLNLGFETNTDDISGGRHQHRFDDDLQFLVGTVQRYGYSVICRQGALYLISPSNDDSPGENISVGVIYLRERSEPALGADTTFTGWNVLRDEAMVSGAKFTQKSTGPVGQPLGEGEVADCFRTANDRQRNLAASWMETELDLLSDHWPGMYVCPDPDGPAYWLTRVEIRADTKDGLRTLLSSKPPNRQRPSPAGFHTGVVDKIGDPDDSGRVRVALNGYDGAVTGWLPVLTSGGGVDTGFTVPLRPGDPVMVAVPSDDPEQGVVLGALLRGGGARSGLVTGETRNGMAWLGDGLSVRLDEAEGRLSMSHESGTSVELSENEIQLKTSDRLALMLNDGTSIEMNPQSIKFTAASDMELNCGGEVKITGSRIDFVEV